MSERAVQATLEELKRGALEHYEDVSMRACHWSSVVPRAIAEYFDRRIAERDARLLAERPTEPPPCPECGGAMFDDTSGTTEGGWFCANNHRAVFVSPGIVQASGQAVAFRDAPARPREEPR